MSFLKGHDRRFAQGKGGLGRKCGASYPLRWRLLDMLDNGVERLLPASTTAVVPALMLAPSFLLVGLLGYGFCLVMGQSLHAMDSETFTLLPEYTLTNYQTIFSRAEYGQLVLRTTETGLLVGGISVVLAFPYAYALVRTSSPRIKKVLLVCVFLPFLLGSVIRGFAWLLILGRDGLINTGLAHLGIAPVSLIYNYTGVLIGLVQLNIPLAVMIVAPALTAINEQIEEAGQSLGAHWLRVMRTVVLPLAVPGLASAFVIIFTLTFSEMVIPSMLGGGRSDLIANSIYNSYVTAADTGTGAALCVMTTFAVVLTVVVCYFASSLLNKGRA